MRLSTVLWKQHLGWMFKQKWKIKSKRIITDYGIPEDLKALNVKVYDALELTRPKKIIPKIEPPDPYKRNPYLLKGPGNPNWHDQHVCWFDRNSILIEGDKQGKVLTKTIGYEGFPSSLQNIINDLSELEIEDSVQHCILESTLWDGIQELLPKRIHPDKLVWNFPRYFGITHNRKIRNLLIGLLHLCEKIAARKNSKNIYRMQIPDPKVKLKLNIYGDPVIFEAVNKPLELPDILLCSNKPLPLLFNKDEIQKTANEELPDLHPLRAVISLEKFNIFTDEKIYPLNKDEHLHTLFITHDSLEEWSTSQKFARALGLSFSYAASHAQLLYGENVKELPTPIVIQCVWIDEGCLGFLSFQLNTLDLDGKDGIKNQLFQAGPFDLYENCNLKSGLTGYNNETFVKMLAMYMNGI